ncbi:DUF4181 domain-containing protein [Planococcus sp. N028]|uniref:DUF4181 domain-containing protein n=1 Tax=Planococcus shixiaomingii TaxID=3058393 RepID=A0ABT8MZ88_9BACL|nr:DUF4181 domain-containing protein [Planococcus sp. N028]MDN7240959.1 DUF4181 domain-containing protein [Planococcus sp. N028]
MYWIKFVLFIIVVFLVISLVQASIRKIFNIEKEKKSLFSYSYVNKTHQNIDLAIRILSMIVYAVILHFLIFKEFSFNLFLIAMTLLTIIDHLVKALFEWKYSENPKQAILTISEMSILVIVLLITIQFDLFHLLLS